MTHFHLLAALVLLVTAACDSTSRQEPLVIYVAGEDESALVEQLSSFTRETGIPVTLRFGESGDLTDSVIENQGSPPADLLLTNNIADIWRAADQGALRPIASSALAAAPEYQRDADAMWIALDIRLAVIAMHGGSSDRRPRNYVDLAETDYKGKLCLVSSGASLSRVLIAMMIDDLGRRPAELIVRKWMHNLALPPFESEQKLRNAIRSGTCQYGILSSAVASELNSVLPQESYFDIDGIGVARHARYPESAQRLMHWLLKNYELDVPAAASQRDVGIAGWRDEEATSLAQRAGYR